MKTKLNKQMEQSKKDLMEATQKVAEELSKKCAQLASQYNGAIVHVALCVLILATLKPYIRENIKNVKTSKSAEVLISSLKEHCANIIGVIK